MDSIGGMAVIPHPAEAHLPPEEWWQNRLPLRRSAPPGGGGPGIGTGADTGTAGLGFEWSIVCDRYDLRPSMESMLASIERSIEELRNRG